MSFRSIMEPLLIDRALSVPLHQQVSEHLQHLIGAGTFADGDELPAEGDLAKHYDVSRSVVRQALSGLVAKGFIETQKGRPASVIATSRKRPVRDVSRAGGLAEELRGQGKNLVTAVISVHASSAPNFLQEKLFLQDCWEIHRLRLIEGQPIIYVINWVPQDLLPSLELEDIQGRSLHELIRETGVELEGGKRYMTAVAAEEPIASKLEVAAGSPLLQVTGETRTTRNSIAEGFKLWHHPSFDLEINASAGSVADSHQVKRIEQAFTELQDAVSSALPSRPKLIDRRN